MATSCRERLLALETAPAAEPLTLAETKLFLRVDADGEDALITQLIAAARQAAERYLRRSLITQRWKLVYDTYLPGEVSLPMGPVQSVIRVTMIARNASTEDVGSAAYYLNAPRTSLVFETSVAAWRVEIVYETGYGAAGTAVPEPIRTGMLAHIAEMYDGRSRALGAPGSVLALYQPYREVTL